MKTLLRLPFVLLVLVSELVTLLPEASQASTSIRSETLVSQPQVINPTILGRVEATAARRRVRYRSPKRYYRLPRWGAPAWSTGGAARGGCTTTEAPVIPLMPVTEEPGKEPTFLGITVAERPTFFAFVPPTSARQVEFLLLDEEAETVIFQQAKSVDGTPQILSFTPDETTAPLEVGKNYKWFFTTICNPKDKAKDDKSANPSIPGLIQRHELNSAIARQLNTTPLRDRPSVYAESGVWLDSLASLAKLRCNQPGDRALASDWKELLQAIELEKVPTLSHLVDREKLNQAPIAQCLVTQP
jgi:hypothetical protein